LNVEGGNTLFSSGNATIKRKIEPVLEGLAGVMKALPYSIAIEGHTDDIPVSSPQFPSNWGSYQLPGHRV